MISCFIKFCAEFFKSSVYCYKYFIPYLSLKLGIKVNCMGPLYVKGVWGSIVATIRQSAWDPLDPGEARHKPRRTTCSCKKNTTCSCIIKYNLWLQSAPVRGRPIMDTQMLDIYGKICQSNSLSMPVRFYSIRYIDCVADYDVCVAVFVCVHFRCNFIDRFIF